MSEEIDLFEYKYVRVGHIDQGRLCDELVESATFLQKGTLLPIYWVLETHDKFIKKYGSGPKWSKTQSYHLFLMDGIPLYRIWTNTKANFVWIDVADALASLLAPYLKIDDIPNGNLVKCKPFFKRIRATDTEAIILLTTMVRGMYGL